MLTKSYKIVEAKRFEVFIEDVSRKDGHCLVRIDRGAICKADLRYYSGSRNKRILDLKYPMSLIHEAIGTVVKSGKSGLQTGDAVVLVPNIVIKRCENCTCQRNDLLENYCPYSLFASSDCDGFSKEIISFPASNLIKISELENCYVFTELVSVAVSALRRVNIENRSRVAVFGDGILGYIMCAVLREAHCCEVFAIGRHKAKLDMFGMCNSIFLADNCGSLRGRFDIGIECVGGAGMQSVIASIADMIEIGGEILLTGVSEDDTPINTRKILEKGLCIKGSTRSSVNDFKTAVSLFENKVFKDTISRLILGEIELSGIEDYYHAFEEAMISRELGKNVLVF